MLCESLTVCDSAVMEGTVTTAELARQLGKSPSAISRMVERGELTPALKLPGLRGAFLFDATALEQLRAEGSTRDKLIHHSDT